MKQRSISGLAALVVLAVFAAGILSVLLTGAGIYDRLTGRSARSGDSRTCAQYLITKVHQAPSPESICLSQFADTTALVIREEISGAQYLTRIYCRDGWLMELFSAADSDLAPEAGEKILPAASLSAQLTGGLLRLDVTAPDGQVQTILLALDAEQEGRHET